jgi:hypothetical protein
VPNKTLQQTAATGIALPGRDVTLVAAAAELRRSAWEGNAVHICSYRAPIFPRTIEELREYLGFRDSAGFACFWLWHESGRELGVMFNCEEAYVHFFPGNGSPGAFALPSAEPENPDESNDFLADNEEPSPVLRRIVVSAAIAEEAIVWFYESGQRLSSVVWEEL